MSLGQVKVRSSVGIPHLGLAGSGDHVRRRPRVLVGLEDPVDEE